MTGVGLGGGAPGMASDFTSWVSTMRCMVTGAGAPPREAMRDQEGGS